MGKYSYDFYKQTGLAMEKIKKKNTNWLYIALCHAIKIWKAVSSDVG